MASFQTATNGILEVKCKVLSLDEEVQMRLTRIEEDGQLFAEQLRMHSSAAFLSNFVEQLKKEYPSGWR
jgi:hypothetical protein